MTYTIEHRAGASAGDARKLAQLALSSHIRNEAYIEAIDDDFLVAGIITLMGIVPIFLLHTKRKNNKIDKEYAQQVE